MDDLFIIVFGVIFCAVAIGYIIVISTVMWLEAESVDKEIKQIREG